MKIYGLRIINLKGKIFSHLTVIDRSSVIARQAVWQCVCSCGTIINARGDRLRDGSIKSCGCKRDTALTHGHSSRPINGNRSTRTYSSWQAMLNRCRNPNETAWKFYGGLGITVCERWNSFENFLSDMGERPAGKTIDRYPNPFGNYEKSNCRWATPEEQARNRRSTKLKQSDVDHIKRSTLDAQHLGDLYSVSRSTIYDIRNGKSWA